MIQITPHMRIMVAVEPVDFRQGIDGLARLCRTIFKQDPFSGYLFVFLNRGRTSMKILCYDGQGFWVCQKRLSQGRFKWWPKSHQEDLKRLSVHELQLLIWNGDPESSSVSAKWRELVN
ncbi:MAG: IS66 family insertion sequence element accessory protein TnpB [Desulfamplus sp.]|nr:IS66 family insertion sequence element accessory protein TnpB [Desulfamplus sp.]